MALQLGVRGFGMWYMDAGQFENILLIYFKFVLGQFIRLYESTSNFKKVDYPLNKHSLSRTYWDTLAEAAKAAANDSHNDPENETYLS